MTLTGLSFHDDSGTAPAHTTGSRPSIQTIVLITVDALRPDRLQTYGYDRPTSPNIDRFARDAVVFSRALAAAPFTKASIASLFSGLYPSAHQTFSTAITVADGMDGEADAAFPYSDVLPSEIDTIAELLRAHGFRTVGLSTNPHLIPDFGFAQGFDTFEFLADGDQFARASAVVQRATRMMTERQGPLFLWLHLMEPHSPYNPPSAMRAALPPRGAPRMIPEAVVVPPWISVNGSRDLRLYNALYDGEVRAADAALGSFFEGLRSDPRWPTTAVILTADHGEQFLEHGGLEHNTALFDELLRVPLIVRVPGLPGRRVGGQVHVVDVYPTIAELVGIAPDDALQGASFAAALHGGAADRSRTALAERPAEEYAVSTDEWKLIAEVGGRRRLYHLTEDPGEQHDVSRRFPQVRDRLETELRHILQRSDVLRRRLNRALTPIPAQTLEQLRSLGYVTH